MNERASTDLDRRARLDRARELRLSKRFDEASRLLQELLSTDPMDFEAIAEGGFLALDNEDYASAEQVLLACRQFLPRAPELLEGAGEAAYRSRAMERAVAHLQAAVGLAEGRIGARLSLGQMLCAVGRAEEGLREIRDCLQLKAVPGSEEGFRSALMRIALGQENAGWREYAAHWEAAHQRHIPAKRWWRGEPCTDEDLYLLSSGGLGDTVLLARFIPYAVERARRVVLGVPTVLKRLLEPLGARTDWSGVYSEIPPRACIASLWHLPGLCSGSGRSDGLTIPYLAPPVDAPRLKPCEAPRVGVAWAGARGVSHDADRSPPSLEALAPMLDVGGISWQGLQPEQRFKDEGKAFGILPLPPVRDIADTAGILSQLDLVITVDSAMANLAGALGVETWVMTPTVPEMRWPPGASRSPWYPNARIFRRSRSANWAEVAVEVRDALKAWLLGTRVPERSWDGSE